MKKTLFLALMLMIAATSFAQQQMATLNHNDTISVFYGTYALEDAIRAAAKDDVITLSAGEFMCSEILVAKDIIIRGATASDYKNSLPTTINSMKDEMYLRTGDYLEIEGVRFIRKVNFSSDINKVSIRFTKCIFDRASFDSRIYEVEMINCIMYELYRKSNGNAVNFNIINSVLYRCNSAFQNMTVYNSLLLLENQFDQYNIINAYNSIIGRHGSITSMSNSSKAYYCILIDSSNGNMYNGIYSPTNMCIPNLSDVFEAFHNINIYSIDEDYYILKEEIATSFLGSDGTEVGIHGGMFPFDTRPSYMVVKKCNVANKSTIDGKLSVDIEVMVEE